jgi:hypothetical protein
MPPPCVLLSGARRSGKCVTVAVVARALGCHLLEMNAFQLVGDTEVCTMSQMHIFGCTVGIFRVQLHTVQETDSVQV